MEQETDRPILPAKASQRIGLLSVPFMQKCDPFNATINRDGINPPGASSVSLKSIGTRKNAQHAPHRIHMF
jgi:hypothetical protein